MFRIFLYLKYFILIDIFLIFFRKQKISKETHEYL
jgi:hypothetical protein